MMIMKKKETMPMSREDAAKFIQTWFRLVRKEKLVIVKEKDKIKSSMNTYFRSL